jgi:FkbM family methyltransferase
MRNPILRELRNFPSFQPVIIFDVGANIGQSAEEFAQYYPYAKILSFEPVPASFDALKENTRMLTNVTAVGLALGNSDGYVKMRANSTSTGNKIVVGSSLVDTIDVRVDTGDRYCLTENITKIGFLKIDTEGYDLRVLSGFQGMLWNGAIDMVQVEVGLAPENRLHVSFEDATSYMKLFDYRLFRLVGVNGNRRLGIDRNDVASAYYGDAVYVRNSESRAIDRAST